MCPELADPALFSISGTNVLFSLCSALTNKEGYMGLPEFQLAIRKQALFRLHIEPCSAVIIFQVECFTTDTVD